MKSNKLAAALLSLGLTVAGSAHAAPIEYIFNGTFDGTLGGTSYTDQAFSVTLTGDTSNVTFSGGEYFNTASSGAFTVGSINGSLGGSVNEIGLNPNFLGGAVIFGQGNTTGFYAEGLGSPALTSYALNTAFPQTSGTITQTAGSTYFTSAGNLVFNNIDTLSFEAEVLPTPLPSSFALFAGALGLMGLLAYAAKRKGGNFSI